MRRVKPTPFLHRRTTHPGVRHLKNSSYEDDKRIDLEIEVLKQRIDSNIKRHLDIRSEIRQEVDNLRQENMDMAAMLHRTDETFYLHQDCFEEVNRLRSMNVRLKEMLCLQEARSIETFGPSKSRKSYPTNTYRSSCFKSPATSYNTKHETRTDALTSPISSQSKIQDAHENISAHSRTLFNRIDKLEAEMKNFLIETSLHPKEKDVCQRKHVSYADIHSGIERITNDMRNLSMNDNPTSVPKQNTTSSVKVHGSPGTKVILCKPYVKQQEFEWCKLGNRSNDRDIHCDRNYVDMNYRSPKPDSESSDDRDVNMNSSRSDNTNISYNMNGITKSPTRLEDENVILKNVDINMNSQRSNDGLFLPQDIESEFMLVKLQPRTSRSGTIIGYATSDNCQESFTNNNKAIFTEVPHCEPAQPVHQEVVSDLVPSYMNGPICIEDLEIRDIFKSAPNSSESECSSSSSERTLKFPIPFTVVSSNPVRPRDVPRLDLSDLVSESDINVVRISQETVEDLMNDSDGKSSVSYIDINGDEEYLENENMSSQGYNILGELCSDIREDNYTFYENAMQSNKKMNLSDVIKKLCANEDMSYMQEFFCGGENDNEEVRSGPQVLTDKPSKQKCTSTKEYKNTTLNNILNANQEKSALKAVHTNFNHLDEVSCEAVPSVEIPHLETHQMETPSIYLGKVNGSDSDELSVPVTPTDNGEDRYKQYMEMCNTTIQLASIIQALCANRTVQNPQESPQHTTPNEEKCPPEIWNGKDFVIANNILRIPAETPNQPFGTDVLKKDNWTHYYEGTNSNGNKDSEIKYAVGKETLDFKIPCCTTDSARSDVSCIDLSLHKETPRLGSTRRESEVKYCFVPCETPPDGSDHLNNTVYTDCQIMSNELALPTNKQQHLVTSLSESHENLVRLLNPANFPHTTDDGDLDMDEETSVQEILLSPDNFSGDYKQTWKPCLMSETMYDTDTDSRFSPMFSHRSRYDVDAEISCIDLSEECSASSFVQHYHSVKEFLRYEEDESDVQGVFYRESSPRWSNSESSLGETSYYSDTEVESVYITASEDESETKSLAGYARRDQIYEKKFLVDYMTKSNEEKLASEDDCEPSGTASSASQVGYERRDQMYDKNFMANYMTKSTMERIDKEHSRALVAMANEDIDKIHKIRIPMLLGEYTTPDTMDSARSDVSCIELSEEEPTLPDISEQRVVKGFLIIHEDNQKAASNDALDQWAKPTKHVTFELAASGTSSEEYEVVLSDIENGDDGSDITGNDVTSVQAFSDMESCVFDMDDQEIYPTKLEEAEPRDPHPSDARVSSNTSPVLPFDDVSPVLPFDDVSPVLPFNDASPNLDVIPGMSDVKKHGPKASFKFLRGLNKKMKKVKQDIMASSKVSKWLLS
ncbi:uncharacterized protein [Argopecten irradians]|uniref:uncharacterized protein isoform X2 n=1 Tax=Argopecten irradians TaxID=31199 RepID=UPI003718DDB2